MQLIASSGSCRLPPVLCVLQEEYQANRDVWLRFFPNLHKLETNVHDPRTRRRFGCFMRSDGVAVSVAMWRPPRPLPPKRDVADERQLERVRTVHEQAHYIVYKFIDPGSNQWITVVGMEDRRHDERDTWSMSTRAWLNNTGITARKRWQEQKLREAPGGLAGIMSGIPSHDTTDVGALQTHIRYVLQHLSALVGHYHDHDGQGRQQHRKKRWDIHITTERWLAKVLWRLCDGAHPWEVLVGLGDWSGGHSSVISRRGLGPTKRLVRMGRAWGMEWLMVPEYRTSQTCSWCNRGCTRDDRSEKEHGWMRDGSEEEGFVVVAAYNEGVSVPENLRSHLRDRTGDRPHALKGELPPAMHACVRGVRCWWLMYAAAPSHMCCAACCCVCLQRANAATRCVRQQQVYSSSTAAAAAAAAAASSSVRGVQSTSQLKQAQQPSCSCTPAAAAHLLLLLLQVLDRDINGGRNIGTKTMAMVAGCTSHWALWCMAPSAQVRGKERARGLLPLKRQAELQEQRAAARKAQHVQAGSSSCDGHHQASDG